MFQGRNHSSFKGDRLCAGMGDMKRDEVMGSRGDPRTRRSWSKMKEFNTDLC